MPLQFQHICKIGSEPKSSSPRPVWRAKTSPRNTTERAWKAHPEAKLPRATAERPGDYVHCFSGGEKGLATSSTQLRVP